MVLSNSFSSYYACLASPQLEHSHANRINSVHLQLITAGIVGATWSRAQCSPNPLLLLLLYTSCWVGAPLRILFMLYCLLQTVVPHRPYPTNVLCMRYGFMSTQGSRSITVLVPCFFTDHSVLLLQLDVPLADWLLMHLVGGRQGQFPPPPPPCVSDADSANVISVTRFLLSDRRLKVLPLSLTRWFIVG